MPFFDSVRNLVNSTTELKVKQITDDNENTISGGTIMNEISVLTYSNKTLKEIISVIRKRLSNGLILQRKIYHKNCIIIIKTLTLILYLINNGSNEFLSWIKTQNYIFEILTDINITDTTNKIDVNICEQIQQISQNIINLLLDPKLLDKKRQNVIEFRTSISSPGRKSTDNSHLTRYSSERRSMDRSNMLNANSPMTSSSYCNPQNKSKSFDILQRDDYYVSSTNNNSNLSYVTFENLNSSGNSNNNNNSRVSSRVSSRNNLGPLTEEDDDRHMSNINSNSLEVRHSSNNNAINSSSGSSGGIRNRLFNKTNPFS